MSGRAVHGWLYLSAAFSDDNSDLSLSATIRNVMTPPNLPSARSQTGVSAVATTKSG